MPEYFSGRVSTLIFENEAQAFYILKMVLDGQTDVVTVRGNILGLDVAVGIWFGFEGAWTFHEQHGRQILISKAPTIQEWTPDVVAGVLSANGVPGSVVSLIRVYFDSTMVEVLDKYDPSLLEEVPGISPSVAEHVITRWRVAKAYFRTLDFLADVGVPRRQVAQVWSLFGDGAEEVLSSNPWALVRIDGITFAQADEVAKKLHLSDSCVERIEGAVRFICKTKKGMGHLYLTSGEIFSEVETLVGSVDHATIAQAIVSLHKQKHLVVDGKTRPGVKAIYEPWLYKIEHESAIGLVDRQMTARLDRDPDILQNYVSSLGSVGSNATDRVRENPMDIQAVAKAALLDWSLGSRISLSDKQQQGVINALIKPVSIITGLPGTGKTTDLKAIISILKDMGVSFLLMAPTGIAAKRMSSITGSPAHTIHRAFGAKGWNKGEEREATYVGVVGASGGESSDGSDELWDCSTAPHSADVIIVDEFSMTDQHLLYRILTCTKPTARLVFIGDAQQLPSVGPGNVLKDMINSKLFPTVALTEIFRQADTSQIVVAAHDISHGQVPSVYVSKDFRLQAARTEEEVLDIVLKLSESMYKRRESFQVMSPRHSGTVGVTNLNARLREPLNPKLDGIQEMRLGSEVVRENDRIMVVKNNYEQDIFNGDVGKVSRLDRKSKEVEIKIHGPPIQYVRIPFRKAADFLRLAYCCTIHKSQGLEYDTIVLPLVMSFSSQLQRNLLYTAITRAKKRVILVGHHSALEQAVANNREDARNTLFLDRLLKHKS